MLRRIVLLAALSGAVPAASGTDLAPRSVRIPADNVILHAVLDQHDTYSDIWGYTAPDGREYALLGTHAGVAIVDVTDRRASREVAFVPGPVSSWRDIKTYGDHMYVVNEAGGGMQIVSLADPASPVVEGSWSAFITAHNLYIDEARGLVFIAGRDRSGGVLLGSLDTPAVPAFVGRWDGGYVHDVFERDGILYASAIYAGRLFLIDVTDPATPELFGAVGPYPDAFTHNAWPTADGSHVLTTDERAGAALRMWDITDPASPSFSGLWRPPSGHTSIPHNVLVKGNLAFVSWYTAGIRVLDVSDPDRMQEVAWYDTFPSSDVGAFAGCWGVFPYFPNSPGLFIASDIHHGLFVLELEPGVAARASAAPAAATAPGIGPDAAPSLEALLALGAPRPNPASGRGTRFVVSLAVPAVLAVDIIDASGRRVRALVRGEAPAGERTVMWDGRDASGRRVAAGTYFVRADTGVRAVSRKITFLP